MNITPEIMGFVTIMSIFTIIMLFAILTGNFWNTETETKCSYCKEKLTSCKITVTNEHGTRVYCDPHCVCNGLKDEELTKGDL